MNTLLRVLIIEDSEDDAILLVRELRRGGYDLTFERVDTPDAMTAALEQQTWDIVVSDYSMPHFGGFAALELLKKSELDLPFIILSGAIGEEIAVESMRTGAHDYIMKDDLARLIPAIERELREAEVRRERKQAEEKLRGSEDKYRDLVENISEVIYTVDKNGVLTYISPAIESFTGYSQSEAIGRPVAEFIYQEDLPRIMEGLQSILSGHNATDDYRVLTKSGEICWIRTFSRPIFIDDRF